MLYIQLRSCQIDVVSGAIWDGLWILELSWFVCFLLGIGGNLIHLSSLISFFVHSFFFKYSSLGPVCIFELWGNLDSWFQNLLLEGCWFFFFFSEVVFSSDVGWKSNLLKFTGRNIFFLLNPVTVLFGDSLREDWRGALLLQTHLLPPAGWLHGKFRSLMLLWLLNLAGPGCPAPCQASSWAHWRVSNAV